MRKTLIISALSLLSSVFLAAQYGGDKSNTIPAAALVDCGETSQSSTDNNNGDYGFGTPCETGTDPNGYTVNSVYYWVGTPTSTSFDLGVYSNSSNLPNSLLCSASTGTITPSSGWNSISVSGCGTLSASTIYWVGYLTGSDSIEQGTVNSDCPGTSLTSVYTSSQQGSATLPNPFGTSGTASACYSFYMALQPK